ncbi:MAG: hypothetical protein ISR62_01550 [Desulfobacteraceae bacterium]|nr:hypothetical protein [Desulfobacterales bacterium]MBL6967092.1 hypothetical protein [Desulfobacteraceae bacterium]MBL7101254.1 hypothetical protein [Desulfobacteraceae bacterium]MBL7171839.1 hypothetical protein [Desulfobacteraceae bacterium]MBU0734675.1 hypothetical protein [Pseudomonadota bacterium]
MNLSAASGYTEAALVEKPAIQTLNDLGWRHIEAFYPYRQRVKCGLALGVSADYRTERYRH